MTSARYSLKARTTDVPSPAAANPRAPTRPSARSSIRHDASKPTRPPRPGGVQILSGEDSRTTLMMRNIPNKYDQRMLLAAIEVNSSNSIDLFYLPIDFKSYCNNGYCFINFTDAACIPYFYKEFDGKRWERCNSEKVAEITYARIQGKEELIKHFSNSSLRHEDKSMQPVVWDNCNGTSVRESIPWHVVGSKLAYSHRNRRRGRNNREVDSGSLRAA